jgi:hypothetical protein
MRDRSRDFLARDFAIVLAQECNVRAVQGVLVQVALDATEDLRLRIKAADAVAAIGDDETKKKLAILVTGAGAADDPEDELKGITLRALWPKQITAVKLFDRLVPPKKEHGHRSYPSRTGTQMRKADISRRLDYASFLCRQWRRLR